MGDILVTEFLKTSMELMSEKFQSNVGLGTDGESITFHVKNEGFLVKFLPSEIDEFRSPDELVEKVYFYHGNEKGGPMPPILEKGYNETRKKRKK